VRAFLKVLGDTGTAGRGFPKSRRTVYGPCVNKLVIKRKTRD